MINGKTRVFGIIGNPVEHSLSPAMHNRAFREIEENGVYVPLCVEDVKNGIAGIKALGIVGVSVTIPHKQEVMAYLDKIDPVASKIGAVNTLHLTEENGQICLVGSNTDWIGANRGLQKKTVLKGKKAILLGAGGSARAIGFGLQEEGATVVLCSRTESSGRSLAEALGCQWYPLDQVEELRGDILINATSVGMKPQDDVSLVPIESLHTYAVVMDIVYSPLKTKLLREAEQAGCQTVNGLEMLLYQGVAQFELWTGRKAPEKAMQEVLLQATGNL